MTARGAGGLGSSWPRAVLATTGSGDPRDDRAEAGPWQLLAPRTVTLATTGLRLTRGTTGLRPARTRPGQLLAPRTVTLATTGLRLTRGTTGLSRPGRGLGSSWPRAR